MNLEEIARLAGVSRSTVSRVVNGDRRVSDAARSRVEEIIRAHDYHPNAAARSLASRRTRILGLLIPQAVGTIFSDPYFPTLVQGVAEACNAADHDLMLVMDPSGEPAVADRLHRRIVRGRHLDGLIIASSTLDDPIVARMRGETFPCVLVGRHPRHELSSVDVDNRDAAQRAVAHLIAHGRRRIAHIGGAPDQIAAVDRAGGYRAALLEADLPPDPALVVDADFTRHGGYLAMRRILARANPDAIFAASDMMAFGAMRSIHEAGLRMPDDIAVFGFDGLDQGSLTQPALSTVTQPVTALGAAAVRVLLDLIERPARAPIEEVLGTRLTLRRSCGCGAEGDGIVPEEVRDRLGAVAAIADV